MRIAFITKPYIIDPLGIAYLSSALKQQGHKIRLFKTDGSRFDTLNLKFDLLEFEPSVLAYSIHTGDHNFYTELNKDLRNHLGWYVENAGLVSIFGGSHCTFFPEIVKEEGVNFVFQGECDELLPKVVNGLAASSKQIFKSECNPQNLDELPFPDRDLIYQFKENADNPIKNIMTSRGCPFKCPYCYNSTYVDMFEGKTIRYRNIDLVIEEALELKRNYPQTKYIFFEDDEFALNMDRLQEFCIKWRRLVRLPFHVQCRIDLLTEGRISTLKMGGCTSVTFAIESGNEETRNNKLDRQMTNKQILLGAKLLHIYGILFRTENMLGIPGIDMVKDALETLDLNIKCKPTIGWASIFQPYPKTLMGERAKAEGYFDGCLDAIPSSFFEKTILKIPNRDKRRIENLQRIFGLVCSFPFLRVLVPLLIELPQNRFFDFIYKWWKNKKYDQLYDVKGDTPCQKTQRSLKQMRNQILMGTTEVGV